MSVISAHIGEKQVNFLVVFDDSSFEVFNFPFVYSEGLFSHFIDEPSFYTDVFKTVIKKYKLDESTCSVLVCGFLRPIKMNIETKINVSSNELLAKNPDSLAFYVSEALLHPLDKTVGEDLKNLVSNLSICPQMPLLENKRRFFIDSAIEFSSDSMSRNLISGKKIVFTGNRFSSEPLDISKTYLLVANLIKSYGVFDVKIDKAGIMLPLCLLKMFDVSLFEIVSKDISFISLGTILKSAKSLECSFQTDIGTNQLFQVPGNMFFSIPLEESVNAKITVKSQNLDQYSCYVTGGDLGFVVDTRPFLNIPKPLVVDDDEVRIYGGWEDQIKEALSRL